MSSSRQPRGKGSGTARAKSATGRTTTSETVRNAKSGKFTRSNTPASTVAQRKKRTNSGGVSIEKDATSPVPAEAPSRTQVKAEVEARYVALQGRGTLTIPVDLRRLLHLDQPGAMAELVVRDDGVLEVRPKVPVSADQAWFWSERWQQMERQADEDVAAGRVTRYDNADGFLTSLETL